MAFAVTMEEDIGVSTKTMTGRIVVLVLGDLLIFALNMEEDIGVSTKTMTGRIVVLVRLELLGFALDMEEDIGVQCVSIGPIAKEPRKNLKVIVEDVTTDFIQNKR